MGTCGTCLFFGAQGKTSGNCYRYPPATVFDGNRLVTAFACVNDNDCCGEHQRIDDVALKLRLMVARQK